jgi:tetratricopeptide (TPR) repeat protein
MLPELSTQHSSFSDQLDLWEHASFLFRHFEWQDAANAFHKLAETAQDSQHRIFFYLNAALILARLGDFDDAADRAGTALYLDEKFALSYYLLGLIDAERSHFKDSLDHFEQCAEVMGDTDIDYGDFGLVFQLCATAAHENASQLWLQHNASHISGVPLRLHSIPAELLFEAPRHAQSQKHTLSTSDNVSTLSRTSPQWSGSEPAKMPKSVTSFSAYKAWLLGRTSNNAQPLSNALTPLAPITKPQIQHKPRDAQVQHESTRDLARFIRHAGPASSNKVVTIDREYMQQLLQNRSVRASLAEDGDSLVPLPEFATRRSLQRGESDGYGSLLDYYTMPERRTPSALNLAESHVPFEKDEQEPNAGTIRTGRHNDEAPWLGTSHEQRVTVRHPSPVLSRRASSGEATNVITPAPSTVSSTEIFRFGMRDAEQKRR